MKTKASAMFFSVLFFPVVLLPFLSQSWLQIEIPSADKISFCQFGKTGIFEITADSTVAEIVTSTVHNGYVKADAGADQTDVPGTSTTLHGNIPDYGAGQWSIISGHGGTLTDPELPSSVFSGKAGATYVLRWTLTSGRDFSTDDLTINFRDWTCGQNITDTRDGKSYATVQIGTQCWMQQNLNVGTRLNGTNNQTNNGTIEKYCYNDLESNCNVYGGLYQWNEMMQYSTTPGVKGICPEGWHIPRSDEINNLKTYVNSQAAYKCNGTVNFIAKSLASKTNWNSSTITCAVGNNPADNNATGFTILPCGYRWHRTGGFYDVGYEGNFWTSSEESETSANAQGLNSNSQSFNPSHPNLSIKEQGLPVRCLFTPQTYVTPPFRYVTLSAGTTTFEVTSNTSWTIDETIDWLSVSPLFGNSDTILTVTYESNYSPDMRTGIISIIFDGEEPIVNVTVTQSLWTCGNNFTDTRDGKSYSTKQIGTQCWMAQNLDIGTRIDGINSQTNNNTIEKYCYDNLESNCEVYGGLYQWDEMMQYSTTPGGKGICQTGWHLPTLNEWETLISYVGYHYNCVGGINPPITYEAKSIAAKTYWSTYWLVCTIGYDLLDNNASGFTGLPGGIYSDSFFNGTQLDGYWWSSSQNDILNTHSYLLWLAYDMREVEMFNYFDNEKTDGLSVRCIANTINADFGSDKTLGSKPFNVQFSDLSGGYPSYWKWDFENDGIADSFEQNPVWTYSESGVYSVSLIASSDFATNIMLKEDFIIVIDTAKVITNPVSQEACLWGYTVLDITAAGDSLTYQWQKEGENIAGANENELIFDSVQASDAGNYRCIVSNLLSSDTSDAAQLNVTPPPYENEEICLVTVDPVTEKNMVIWEKTPDVRTAYYNIFRLIGNTYQKIDTVNYNNLSTYVDFTVNPYSRKYTYKISVVDSCGNESGLSEYHNTIHLVANRAVNGFDINLEWNEYSNLNFDYYYIYRGSAPDNLSKIDSVDINVFSYTDFNPPSFEIYYKVGIEKSDPCNPTANKAGPFKQSLSNIADSPVQVLSMSQGWNGISLNIMPNNPWVQNIFSPIVNDLVIVKNLSKMYWPAQGINTILFWDFSSGYAAKLSTARNLQITGTPIPTHQLTLTPNWNYLPVLNRCNSSLPELFGGHNANVIIAQELIGTKVFWPAMNIYTLDTIVPGKTYKIKLIDYVTFNFPSCDSKDYSFPQKQINTISTLWGELKMNPLTHLVAFSSIENQFEISEGDQIGAFNTQNLLCGFVTIGNTKYNSAITLYGDDPTNDLTDGFSEGELIRFKLFRPSSRETIDLDVEFDPDYDNDGKFKTDGLSVISNIKTSSNSTNENATGNIRIYPNPTDGKVEIVFDGVREKATVTVSNLQNKEYLVFEMDGTKQEQKKQIDLSAYPPGIYLITVSGESFRIVEKLVVM